MSRTDGQRFFSKYSTALLIICGTLVMDAGTKSLVHNFLAPGDFIEIIPGLFNLNHVHNPGAAFGMLSSLAPHIRQTFFGIVTLLATMLFALQLKNSPAAPWEYVAYSLIIGGGLGNSANRLVLGHVVDFLDFHWVNTYHYPSFNVADIAICSGGNIILLEHLKSWKRKQKRNL